MTRSALALVTEQIADVQVVDHEAPFLLWFEQYHRTATGGAWRSHRHRRHHWGAWLEAPPRLRDWTAATVEAVIAVAKAELTRRGVRGRLRIAAIPDDRFIASTLTLEVRRGACRARLALDAAVHRPIPSAILFAVAGRVSRRTQKLTYAVQHVGRRSGDAR